MSDSSGCRDVIMKMNKLMEDQNVGTRFIASTQASIGLRQGRDKSRPYTHIRDYMVNSPSRMMRRPSTSIVHLLGMTSTWIFACQSAPVNSG